MSDRYAQVVILAEDELSANLLRRYVQRVLRIGPRKLQQEISPPGRGDAKRWVLGRYPFEVRELRKGLRRTGLIVHLDADTDTVFQRANELAAALGNANLDNRTDNERISHVIPCRHTETWLCFFSGIDVDERRDCKRERLLRNPDEVVISSAQKL